MTTYQAMHADGLVCDHPPLVVRESGSFQPSRTVHPAVGYLPRVDDLGEWGGYVDVVTGVVTVETDGATLFTPVLALADQFHTSAAESVERIALRYPGAIREAHPDDMRWLVVWTA